MVLVTIPRPVRVKRTTLSYESLSNSVLRSARGTGRWGRVCAARRRVLVPCRCSPSFPTRRLQIVFVGTEVSPWSKVGGLGDVLGSLPPALAKRGHRVMTVSPRYEPYDDIYDSGYLIPLEIPEEVGQENCKTASGDFSRLFLAHQESVDRVFVDHPLFKPPDRDPSQLRKMIYPYHGGDSKEFEICCSVLCQSALAAPAMVWGKGYSEAAVQRGKRGDSNRNEPEGHNEETLVFVANDWPCGILPMWLENYKQHLNETPPVLNQEVLERSSTAVRGNSFSSKGNNNMKDNVDEMEGAVSSTNPESVSEAGGGRLIEIGALLSPEVTSKEGGSSRERGSKSSQLEEVGSAPLAVSRKPRGIKKSKPKIDPEGSTVESGGRQAEDVSPIRLVDDSDGDTIIENISNRGLNEGKPLESSRKNSSIKAKSASPGGKPRRNLSVSASDFESEIGPLKSSGGEVILRGKLRNIRREVLSDMQPLISAPKLDKFQAWVGSRVAKSKIVFAIHNMAYQGRNLLLSLGKIRLPWPVDESMNEPPWDWNWLKAGLLWSDKAVTVSPGYAAELMKGGQESCGMGDALKKAGGVTGIRNGLDTDSWNPKTDKFLAEELRYGLEDISDKKATAKALLQEKLGLKVTPETPLLGFVGRLEFQKGADVLLSAAPELITTPDIAHPPNFSRVKNRIGRARNSRKAPKGFGPRRRKGVHKRRGRSKSTKKEGKVQFVMLGRGDHWLEAGVRALKYSFPGNAAGITEFDEELAHLIMAGCDYLIVPSRFEPCGLVAMCAVAYGCVPIVTPVGGLMELAKEEGVGYVMSSSFHDRPYREGVLDLVATVRRAVKDYGSNRFDKMRRKCMSIDMSWDGPAEKWEKVLLELQDETD